MRIVRVAPLRSLPAHAATFDYVWTAKTEPLVGMLLVVPFRHAHVCAIVVATLSESTFATRELDADVSPVAMLFPVQVAWYEQMAKKLTTAPNTLLRLAIPPFTPKTILSFRTRMQKKDTSPTHARASLRYAWYHSRVAHNHILHTLLTTTKNVARVAVCAPTHARAQEIHHALASYGISAYLYRPTPQKDRLATWHAWMYARTRTIFIGTHLMVWLPTHQKTAWILDDPSHPAHVQWDGAVYDNRIVLHERSVAFGESLVCVAHTPHTNDLDRAHGVPTLTRWPNIIDATVQPPESRACVCPPQLDAVIQSASRVLFLLPHISTRTYHTCRDCGAPHVAQEETVIRCRVCSGTNLYSRSFGADSLYKELRERDAITHTDSVARVDAHTLKKLMHAPPDAHVVFSTAACVEVLTLASFDCVIDLSSDFVIAHPQFDTEERLIARIRGMATQFDASWNGVWCVVTHHADLAAWKAGTTEGYARWWQQERPLRVRFAQPPFA